MESVLELARATAIGHIANNLETLPPGSAEYNLLKLFVDSRKLMQVVDIRKSLFVEELAWLKHIDIMGRWVYSRGITEKCCSEAVQELLRLGLQSIDLTLQKTLICSENPAASASTTFFNDSVMLCHEQLGHSFLINAPVASTDLHSLFPLMSMRSGEVRAVVPLTKLEASVLEHVERFTDESQPVGLRVNATRNSVLLAPTADDVDIEYLYNKWIKDSSRFDIYPPHCEFSLDGKVCSLDKIRLGEISRLLLYLKDKYDTCLPAGHLFMTNETILKYCCEPVTVAERFRELVYFHVQGDVNPFVFLAGNREMCLGYAKSVLNRTSIREGPVRWPLSAELEPVYRKKNECSERKYPPIVKVAASANVVVRNYNVHQTDGKTIKRFWVKDDDKDLPPEVISAIAEYEKNELVKLSLNN